MRRPWHEQANDASGKPARKISTAYYNWRLIRYAPWPLLLLIAGDLLFYGSRVVPGLIEKAAFDKLTGAAPVQLDIWALIVLYVSVELGARGRLPGRRLGRLDVSRAGGRAVAAQPVRRRVAPAGRAGPAGLVGRGGQPLPR